MSTKSHEPKTRARGPEPKARKTRRAIERALFKEVIDQLTRGVPCVDGNGSPVIDEQGNPVFKRPPGNVLKVAHDLVKDLRHRERSDGTAGDDASLDAIASALSARKPKRADPPPPPSYEMGPEDPADALDAAVQRTRQQREQQTQAFRLAE